MNSFGNTTLKTTIMRILLLWLCSIMLTHLSFGQNVSNLYKTGDSLYKVKNYKNAAIAYDDGIRMEGQAANIGRYRSSAAAWALGAEADSAFHYLNIIAGSDKTNKVVAWNIEYG